MIRSRNTINKTALDTPLNSVWYSQIKNADDSSLLNLIGFTRTTFQKILREFSKYYIVKSGVGKKGRPTTFADKGAVLSMLLHFYTGSMELKTLCELFGVPLSTLSRSLSKAETALSMALKNLPDARIKYPSLDEQRQWSQLVENKEPLVKKRWGFIDGKNYCVQKPSDIDLQNAMYNGWLHATLITGTLCFGVDGCIVWGRHNFVGSWNDGDTSRLFQEKLRNIEKNLPGYGVVADSAFPVSGVMYNLIVTPLKEGDLDRMCAEDRVAAQAVSNAITSIRQAAEWGMGAVEKPFRRLKMPLPYNPVIRQKRILNIHHLYNLRVRTTGISQIRTVFQRYN
jgi:hypothetical protein